jgi:hypothetical protein
MFPDLLLKLPDVAYKLQCNTTFYSALFNHQINNVLWVLQNGI